MLEKDLTRPKSSLFDFLFNNKLWDINMIIPDHSDLQGPLGNKFVPKMGRLNTILKNNSLHDHPLKLFLSFYCNFQGCSKCYILLWPANIKKISISIPLSTLTFGYSFRGLQLGSSLADTS
jgi:hypothetical protein